MKPGAPLSVNQLYERYRRAEDRTIRKLLDEQSKGTLTDASLEEQWMIKYSQAIPIKFIAVWDTVGAVGVPFGKIRGISRSTLGFLHTGLRIPIENGFHALAVDEHRLAFSPTLWTVRTPKDPDAVVAAPRPITSVEQRWFVGAHANVGGGYQSDLLAQVPLRWIMNKASLHGLAFRNDVELDGDMHNAAISDSYSAFMSGAYRGFSWRHYRPIGAPPKERDDGKHTTVNETIDATVFDRWQNVPEYRPPNLLDWAHRYKVTVEKMNRSVRADNPEITAPD